MPIPKDVSKRNEHLQQRKVVEVIGDEEGNVYPMTEDSLCVFLNAEGRCAIYDDHPDVCRRYSRSEDLQCPYIKLNGNPRSPAPRPGPEHVAENQQAGE